VAQLFLEEEVVSFSGIQATYDQHLEFVSSWGLEESQ